MVKIALQITCRLDNVDELRPSGKEFRWCLKFTCSNCGETTNKWNYVSLMDAIPMQVGNGFNHFVSKCKCCLRDCSMTIIEDSIKPFTIDDQEQFKTIVVFSCRGLEPSDFSPAEGWIVKTAKGGKTFTEVDLNLGEWGDYCDKIKEPVGIYDIKHKWLRLHKSLK